MSSVGMQEEQENDQRMMKVIHDHIHNEIYDVVDVLGTGKFGPCYEVVNRANENQYAVKIIPKKMLTAEINWEFSIHMKLKHNHVVRFHSQFEDDMYLYILLENCRFGSMRKLLNKRTRITELECRCYLKQMVEGVQYLHENNVVHCALKLDNFLVSDRMQVKICNFEYSKVVQKQQLANSSVIAEKGYLFELDILGLGCTIYELLIGESPLEESQNITYENMENMDFPIPHYLSHEVTTLIRAMLHRCSKTKLAINELWNFDFLKKHEIPYELAESVQFESPYKTQIKEILIQKENKRIPVYYKAKYLCDNMHKNSNIFQEDLQNIIMQIKPAAIGCLVDNMLEHNNQNLHTPLWVNNWFDNSGQNAFAYELCDKSLGVIFIDNTRIVLMPDQRTLHYVDKMGEEYHMGINAYWKGLEIKRQLLLCFKSHMDSEVDQIPAALSLWDSKRKYCHPQVLFWWRIDDGVIMYLSNGLLQINFVDQIKMTFSANDQTFMYFDEYNKRYIYRLSELNKARFQPKIVYILKQLRQIQKGLNKKIINKILSNVDELC